ncbi:MAG: thymidine phosphorylase [Rhodothermales bacterium]
MAERHAVDIIIAKRDGLELDRQTIRTLVAAYSRGDVPDYQMSAFLMAAFLQGMSSEETYALTDAMLASGQRIDLSHVPGRKVGKHSTGGVGDKVSLVLAPIVAACGVPVPKISGRGLGFTGGTLDKLESIPGLHTGMSADAYCRQVAEVGLVIAGQTAEIAPADKALYALRDVTGTVDFIPFIASSIMSKKLAEGIDALVLDVKCGRGAFMKEEADARQLAETLVGIGERMQTETVAWVTRMDAPLGRAAGNWPEIVEAVRCLQGDDVADLMEVVYTLAGDMLVLGRQAQTRQEGTAMAREAVATGRALDAFIRMVDRQGGDARTLDRPNERPGYEPAGSVNAVHAGYVASVDAGAVGHAVARMGAGRRQKDEEVDPLAGVVLNKKPGDAVAKDETLAWLYTHRVDALDSFRDAIGDAYRIQDDETAPPSTLVVDRFAGTEWQRGS